MTVESTQNGIKFYTHVGNSEAFSVKEEKYSFRRVCCLCFPTENHRGVDQTSEGMFASHTISREGDVFIGLKWENLGNLFLIIQDNDIQVPLWVVAVLQGTTASVNSAKVSV